MSTLFGAENVWEELPWLTNKPKRFISKLEHPLSNDCEPLERPSLRETIEIRRSQPKVDDSPKLSPSGADLAVRRSPPPLAVEIESRCV